MTGDPQLLDTLEELRTRLDTSTVQRTVGLREAMGTDCEFYSKSLRIFIDKDYIDIMQLVLRAAELFERENNG